MGKHREQEEAMANATRRSERVVMAPRWCGARSSGSGSSVEPQRCEARDRERRRAYAVPAACLPPRKAWRGHCRDGEVAER